jgi:hypothetical protein
MNDTVQKLQELLKVGHQYMSNVPDLELSQKTSPEKWSKKEILGHLIDSGINNLQRFTEIQFEDKPYRLKKYNQDELVKVNNYQAAVIKDLLNLWTSINKRIIDVMSEQSQESLNYKVELDNGKIEDLKFLMIDYVVHLEYHLKQIVHN